MVTIDSFGREDRDEVIALVLRCQNDGTRPLVGVKEQPDLMHIPECYIEPGGNFWVAKDNERVAGCIGLMNCGNGIGVLKKFFTAEAYRGEPHHLGQKLYGELLAFARRSGFTALVLDTPKNTERAHKFYERAGFRKINENEMPVQYEHPYEDSDFFLLELHR